MTDDIDPREVLNRINSRIGKTQDPFAVYKLEETRAQLQQAIDEYDTTKRHYKVILAGHGQVESDESEEIARMVQEQIQEREEKAKQMARFIASLLDAADDGRNLREFIEEQRQEQMRAVQAQQQGMPPGPMGPQ